MMGRMNVPSSSRLWLSVFCLAAFVVGAAGARAQTCTVTSNADSGAGTLRNCLSSLVTGTAANTNVITITATGTISLASTLPTIAQGVTINGPGANQLTIDGGGTIQEMIVSGSGINVSVSGLTFANGKGTGGGAIELDAGTLMVNNSAFTGNAATADGGAIGSFPSSALTVSGSFFWGNTSSGYGGAIQSSGALTATDSTFSGNTATTGGGAIEANGASTITNNTFVANSSPQGGAIAFLVASQTVDNNLFSGNTATTGGAAIVQVSGTVTADTNLYYHNLTNGSEDNCNNCSANTNPVSPTLNPLALPLGNYGGTTESFLPQPGSAAIGVGSTTATDLPGSDQRGFALNNTAGSVDIGAVQTNYIEVQAAGDGGAGAGDCPGASCTLRDAIAAAGAAGDIDFAAGVTTVTLTPGNGALTLAATGGIEIVGPGANALTVNGGGSSTTHLSVFSVSAGDQALLYGMTISGGYAAGFGGGGVFNQGTLTVLDSAISGNTSIGNGGGIENSGGALTVLDSTISGNTANTNGGGIDNEATGATASITESTVSGNSDSGGGEGGGGIATNVGTVMTITASTIWNNTDGASGDGGGGIAVAGGSLNLANSIVADNASGVSGQANIFGAASGTGNIIGGTDSTNTAYPGGDTTKAQIMLSGLELNGASDTVPTLIPLPGGTLGNPVICAGVASNIPSDVTTDERGYVVKNTTYTGYSSGNPCVDAGAVQTNYSMSFTASPTPTTLTVDEGFGAGVTLDESGAAFTETGVTIPVAISSGTLYGTASETTSAGVATFSGLTTDVGSGLTLTSTLSLNAALTTPLSLTASTSSFDVNQAASTVFSLTPTTLTATVDNSATFTAKVEPSGVTNEVTSGSIVPFTGTVTFFEGGTALGDCTGLSVTSSAGVATATCVTKDLAGGSGLTVTAQYNAGDTNYAQSAVSVSPAISTITVTQASTTTALVSNTGANSSTGASGSSTVNGSVTFTATVSAPAGATVPLTGNVIFTDNGNPITSGSGVTCGTNGVVAVTWISSSATGTAQCVTSALTGGNHSIVAAYNKDSSDPSYLGSNNNVTEGVSAEGTTVAAPTSSPASPTAGEQFTVSATVSATGTLTVPFSGTMQFFNGGTAISSCTAVKVNTTSGVAQCQVSGLGANTYDITAQYNSGDASYSQSAVSTALSLVIGQNTGAPSVTSSANTSTVNQSVTFTATLTTNGLNPTGKFSFTDTPSGGSEQTICSNVSPSSAGVATCADNSLIAGSHTIQATYSGDPNFGTVTGTLSGGQTVNKASTSVVVTNPTSTSTVDEQVTFTATVTPSQTGGVALDGDVTFSDVFTPLGGSAEPSTTICGPTNVSVTGSGTGVATCPIATLGLGSHAITATYNGDSKDTNFSSSNSPAFTQTVNAASSSITLSSSSTANTSTVNQTVTFTASIPGPSGTTKLTGQVAFEDNGSPITGCTAVGVTATSSTNWTAVCPDPSLTAAGSPHTITATYGNDSNFTVGGGSLSQTVNKASTNLTVVSGVDPSQVGAPVTFTATVTPNPTGSYTPTGTVAFTDSASGPITGCAAETISTATGQAKCTTSTLAVDQVSGGSDVPHSITATYSGDSNFSGNSNTASQTVQANSEVITFPATTPTASTVNQTVSFTAQFAAPASGTRPSGVESYTDNGNPIASCTNMAPVLSGGNYVTTCTYSAFTAGNHTIVASYSGDLDLTLVSGSATLTVSAGASNTTVTSSLNPSVSGANNANNYKDSVTITATVTPVQTGPVALSGAVTFSDNGAVIPGCSGISIASTSGVATCTTSTLPSGLDSVIAVYSGDSNFFTSSFTLSQSVQDYSLVVSSTPPVEVSQGYTSSSDLFTPQTMSVAPVSIQGFATASGSPLTLTCTVTEIFSPASSPTSPLCNLASSTLAVNGTGAQGAAGLVIDATNASAGLYSVEVNGVDPTTGLARNSAPFIVTVNSASTPLTFVSGATTGNSGSLTFLLPANVSLTNLACQSVSGPNLTGSVSPSSLSISCSFNPTTIPSSSNAQAAQVTVTVNTSGSTTAAVATHTNLWFAGLLGLPMFGLIGLIGGRKSSRSVFFRVIAIVVICVVAFQAIGCGGSFNTKTSGTGGGKTPPGVYKVLVVGTGSDGQTYEAVLQLNVQL